MLLLMLISPLLIAADPTVSTYYCTSDCSSGAIHEFASSPSATCVPRGCAEDPWPGVYSVVTCPQELIEPTALPIRKTTFESVGCSGAVTGYAAYADACFQCDPFSSVAASTTARCDAASAVHVDFTESQCSGQSCSSAQTPLWGPAGSCNGRSLVSCDSALPKPDPCPTPAPTAQTSTPAPTFAAGTAAPTFAAGTAAPTFATGSAAPTFDVGTPAPTTQGATLSHCGLVRAWSEDSGPDCTGEPDLYMWFLNPSGEPCPDVLSPCGLDAALLDVCGSGSGAGNVIASCPGEGPPAAAVPLGSENFVQFGSRPKPLNCEGPASEMILRGAIRPNTCVQYLNALLTPQFANTWLSADCSAGFVATGFSDSACTANSGYLLEGNADTCFRSGYGSDTFCCPSAPDSCREKLGFPGQTAAPTTPAPTAPPTTPAPSSAAPTAAPSTESPTSLAPTGAPTGAPTDAVVTSVPTGAPNTTHVVTSHHPTVTPGAPTKAPTVAATEAPTAAPTYACVEIFDNTTNTTMSNCTETESGAAGVAGAISVALVVMLSIFSL